MPCCELAWGLVLRQKTEILGAVGESGLDKRFGDYLIGMTLSTCGMGSQNCKSTALFFSQLHYYLH